MRDVGELTQINCCDVLEELVHRGNALVVILVLERYNRNAAIGIILLYRFDQCRIELGEFTGVFSEELLVKCSKVQEEGIGLQGSNTLAVDLAGIYKREIGNASVIKLFIHTKGLFDLTQRNAEILTATEEYDSALLGKLI